MMMKIDGSGRAREETQHDEIFTPIETGGSSEKGDVPYSTETGYILTTSYLLECVAINGHGWMIVDW